MLENTRYLPHPLANKQVKFKTLSDWILVDGYCAMRYKLGQDPDIYDSRVAFIEKTARVRLLSKKEEWEYLYKSSKYGLSQESLKACDKKLLELGFI